MTINALDHVNIVTDDVEGTAHFYAELFGLDRQDGPPPMRPEQVQWMYEAGGRAIFHINSVDLPRPFDREGTSGPTGAIHHVALDCSGYDKILSQIDAWGLDRQVSLIGSLGLRQIFVFDPNGVLLELNFRGD